MSTTNEASGMASKTFEIDGLAPQNCSTPTGMRDEIILIAWLIVLMRVQESSLVRCEWQYQGSPQELENGDAVRSLSPNDVMIGLQSHTGQSAAILAGTVPSITEEQQSALSSPASIRLSTGPLSLSSEDAKDEVSQGDLLFIRQTLTFLRNQLVHLELRRDGGKLCIQPLFSTDDVPAWTISRLMETLADTMRTCILHPYSRIEDGIRPAARDLDDLWGWNHSLPPTLDYCMHDVISEQARSNPDKVAIASWDGELTYGQVDKYSTITAGRLVSKGVKLHDFVPLCFEKSRWTIVAVLAVMKVGGTLVMMDPSLPLARLQNMATQVNATTMLSSRQQERFSKTILPDGNLLIVEADSFSSSSDLEAAVQLEPVPPAALMYLIFTSGSTGTPKGVKISHRTYTSSAIPRAQAVGYTPNSRVLDFASYAFDVSIDSMLLTLGNGGCLCIPSDEDRMNDINNAIRKMQINYAGITPSLARILEPDVIASLEALGLGGEAAAASDVALWGQSARIVIGYGPCECTIGCTINSDTATGRPYISIGTGNGAAMWIVDPNDHEVLLPVGAVGELLVEGPIVGQGYLNDPEKTAAAFIEDPAWLTKGHKHYTGRRGRLYKTGDLGKYDPDGSGGIIFAGRKDTQVKLRGQRVELSEIESQLNARLPSDSTVIVEVIKPTSSGGQPTLVAFVTFQSLSGTSQDEIKSVELPEDLRNKLSEANEGIVKVLPRYMIPTTYIPVNILPVLISGKTDRKRLRQFGIDVDLQNLDRAAAPPTESRELNDLELRLRQVWSTTLKLDEGIIGANDNFFVLGGDSLAAMKMVSACREQGLEVTVTDTFNNPTLAAMASVVRTCDSSTAEEMPAFSMISRSVEEAQAEAAEACGVEPTAVEDIYPCTATQESLFTFSLKSTKAYIAQRVSRIPEQIDLEAWKRAWEHVVATSPILRTRLAQLKEPGLQQVVLKEGVNWRASTSLKRYLEDDLKERSELGQGLARYAIVEDAQESQRYMVWTVHHVLYDGWSEPTILQKISDYLQDDKSGPPAYMKDFVKFLVDTDAAKMKDFWRQELDGASGSQFPRLPTRDYMPTPNGMVERIIPLKASDCSPFTKATIVRGAWALVASQYTGNDDVVFGETMTGRDIPLRGAENIVGPMIATIPMRVRVRRNMSVEAYLQAVQQGVLARIPYQHMGMQNIRKVSQDAQYACEAGTGLVIQPELEYDGDELGFAKGDPVREALHFNPYPLMLAFGIRNDGFRVCASFDRDLVAVAQMERVLAQLEAACSEIVRDLSRSLNEVSSLPSGELDQIWSWNKDAPLECDSSSDIIRASKNLKQGSVYPRAVIPWVCNPVNSALLSPIGSVGELWLEGNVLPGNDSISPSWLLEGSSEHAGRSSPVKPTGDLVQLQADGSLLFVGRKDEFLSAQGHTVDAAELEAHAKAHLPQACRAITAEFHHQMSTGTQQPTVGSVLFIEQPPFEDGALTLLSEPKELICGAVSAQSCQTTICATVSTDLAAATKRLDKFIRDSLPSYMMPSAYIIVDNIPLDSDGQVDRDCLNRLATSLSPEDLNQITNGLQQAWASSANTAKLSGPAGILRAAWSEVLRIPEQQIDVDDNFFRLGGDSVLAMKLISNLRAQGHGLTVADIFQNMRLSDAARVLKVNHRPQAKAQSYKPFSTLTAPDTQRFVSQDVQPKLANQSWTVQDVLPATEMQVLDIKATIRKPRTSVQYTMMMFEGGVDRQRLIEAYGKLVKTHDMLRTVFVQHESEYYQVVLEDLEAPIALESVDATLGQGINELCLADADSDYSLGSPFLKASLVESKDGRTGLVVRLSHAQYDGVSLPRLLRDLETLYTGAQLADFVPFPAYVAAIQNESNVQKAQKYWSTLLNGSSLSVLEGTSKSVLDRGLFLSKEVAVPNRPSEITTSNLLTAAWALFLARSVHTLDVTFGAVSSGRNIDLANVEEVVGPCYNIIPVRVKLDPGCSYLSLLRSVQAQMAESTAYDTFGFGAIARSCGVSWGAGGGSSSSFDSIVHHQDFEDFDEMPFGDVSCKVDILNPHGDAAYPFKAVTFVKQGKLHVGVVGSEKDATRVEEILEMFAGVVEEVAAGGEKGVEMVFDQ
jgi:amino acid adenylation domain-containing protein